MKLTTKHNNDLAVRRGKDKEGHYIELQVETDNRGVIAFLTPPEAERLGNALIKAAQPKKRGTITRGSGSRSGTMSSGF